MSPYTPRPRSNERIKELVPPEAIDWFCPACGRFIGTVYGEGVVVVVHRCGVVAHLRFSVAENASANGQPATT